MPGCSEEAFCPISMSCYIFVYVYMYDTNTILVCTSKRKSLYMCTDLCRDLRDHLQIQVPHMRACTPMCIYVWFSYSSGHLLAFLAEVALSEDPPDRDAAKRATLQ